MTEQEIYAKIYNNLRYVNNNLYSAISKLDTVYNNMDEAIKVNGSTISTSTISDIRKGLSNRRYYISNTIMYEVSKKM